MILGGLPQGEAELDPEAVGICHCTDCQALSASAFHTVGIVKVGDFRLLTGDPKIYVKTAANRRSVTIVVQVFMPHRLAMTLRYVTFGWVRCISALNFRLGFNSGAGLLSPGYLRLTHLESPISDRWPSSSGSKDGSVLTAELHRILSEAKRGIQ